MVIKEPVQTEFFHWKKSASERCYCLKLLIATLNVLRKSRHVLDIFLYIFTNLLRSFNKKMSFSSVFFCKLSKHCYVILQTFENPCPGLQLYRHVVNF